MSDHEKNTTATETASNSSPQPNPSQPAPSQSDPSQTNPSEKTNPTSQSICQRASCCKPHASLYISIIALLLAAYAAFNVSASHDNSAMQTQLNSLDSNVADINQQIETLQQDVQHNRDNLVQNKLKKALENIRDISGIAEEGSKAAISKVEQMLQKLTTLGEQLVAPSAVESSTPESSAGDSSSASSTIKPATTPTDESTTAQPSAEAAGTSPQAETTGTTANETPTVPVTNKTSGDKTNTDSITPVTPSPATKSSIEPAAKATPAIDQSAPQAF